MHRLRATFAAHWSWHEYRRLNDSRNIRILELQAGAGEAKLEGRLREVSISDSAIYEAVSYTWACEGPDQHLRIASSGVLKISNTLASALRQLRYLDRPRSLWIDAICINQFDDVEKSAQVQMMRQIFHQAEQVVVWLGEEADNSDLVFEFMRSISQAAIDWASAFDRVSEDDSTKSAHAETLLRTFAPGSPAQTSLGHFLQRAWFRRVWIQQEVVVARRLTMICGEQRSSWSAFFALMVMIVAVAGPGNQARSDELGGAMTFVAFMIPIERMRQGNLPANVSDLLRELARCRNCFCTDPRDRLFAVQGLVAEWTWLPRIDYSSNCAEVFTRFSAASAANGDLDILGHAGQHYHQMKDLPSWVPDWTHAKLPRAAGFHRDDTASGFASASSRSLVRGMDNLLIVAGFNFDIIKDVSGHIPEGLSPTEAGQMKMILEERCEVLAGSIQEQTNVGPVEALWYTLMFASYFDPALTPPTTFEESRNWRIRRRLITGQMFTFSDNDECTQLDRKLLKYDNAINWGALFECNQLCVTRKGYVGVVPTNAKPGDRVCIALGCSSPLVLEGKDSKVPSPLRGAAYIHGLMHGEAMDTNQPDIFASQPSNCPATNFALNPLPPGWKRCRVDEIIKLYAYQSPERIWLCPRHPKFLTKASPRLWTKVVDPRSHTDSPAANVTDNSADSITSPKTPDRWMTDFGCYYSIHHAIARGVFESPGTKFPSNKDTLPSGCSVVNLIPPRTYFKNEAERLISFSDPRLHLAGPMPQGWEMTFDFDRETVIFYDTVNDRATSEDPRLDNDPARKLGPLPQNWAVERHPESRELIFTYLPTGEKTTEDPCLPRDGYKPNFQGFVIK